MAVLALEEIRRMLLQPKPVSKTQSHNLQIYFGSDTVKYLCISSFKMIIDLIKSGYGISFVYEVLAKSDPELGIFTLKGEPIVREFNVIYLKHADVREKMEWFL